jgi:hypothetical protein
MQEQLFGRIIPLFVREPPRQHLRILEKKRVRIGGK